jgi:hypothetical protein
LSHAKQGLLVLVFFFFFVVVVDDDDDTDDDDDDTDDAAVDADDDHVSWEGSSTVAIFFFFGGGAFFFSSAVAHCLGLREVRCRSRREGCEVVVLHEQQVTRRVGLKGALASAVHHRDTTNNRTNELRNYGATRNAAEGKIHAVPRCPR